MRVFAAVGVVTILACQCAGAAMQVSAVADVEWSRAGDMPAGNSNSIGGSGAVVFSFDKKGLNLQLGGGGATTLNGGAATIWTGGGDLFWRDSKGVMGVSVSHGSLQWAGINPSLSSYGGFGEWYASENLTVRVKGGGFSGDVSGYYGGAGVAYYIHPFADLFAEGDYVHMTGASSWTGGGGVEFMLSSRVPLSVRAGSSYTTTQGAHVTAFFAGLRYRFNLGGSLVDIDRSGPVSWNGAISLQ